VQSPGKSGETGTGGKEHEFQADRVVAKPLERLLIVAHGGDGASIVPADQPAHDEDRGECGDTHDRDVAPDGRRPDRCDHRRYVCQAPGTTRPVRVLDDLEQSQLEADARDDKIIAGYA